MNTQQAIEVRGLSDPETWVERYGDVLFRYALVRLRDALRAEDAVQETFLAALQARSGFSGKSSERTWLVGILKHKIIDQFRRLSREQPVETIDSTDELDARFDKSGHWKVDEGLGPIEWTGASANALVEQKEFLEVLQRCMAKLPPRLAEAFSLRELEECGTDELCQVLSISSTNVWVMLHRARRQLRQCLELNWFGSRGSADPQTASPELRRP